MMGQAGDSTTLQNIRKDLHLDKPRWKQFALYLNDLSPVSYYERKDIESLSLSGILLGKDEGICIKFPYFRKSYHSKEHVSVLLMEALPGTIILALAAMLFATII